MTTRRDAEAQNSLADRLFRGTVSVSNVMVNLFGCRTVRCSGPLAPSTHGAQQAASSASSLRQLVVNSLHVKLFSMQQFDKQAVWYEQFDSQAVWYEQFVGEAVRYCLFGTQSPELFNVKDRSPSQQQHTEH